MIVFNYKEAMAQATELDRICDELETLINRSLRPGQAELQQAWTGDGARLFQQKTDDLLKDITKTTQTASRISSSVRTAAKAIKTAEEAAERIIKGG